MEAVLVGHLFVNKTVLKPLDLDFVLLHPDGSAGEGHMATPVVLFTHQSKQQIDWCLWTT